MRGADNAVWVSRVQENKQKRVDLQWEDRPSLVGELRHVLDLNVDSWLVKPRMKRCYNPMGGLLIKITPTTVVTVQLIMWSNGLLFGQRGSIKQSGHMLMAQFNLLPHRQTMPWLGGTTLFLGFKDPSEDVLNLELDHWISTYKMNTPTWCFFFCLRCHPNSIFVDTLGKNSWYWRTCNAFPCSCLGFDIRHGWKYICLHHLFEAQYKAQILSSGEQSKRSAVMTIYKLLHSKRVWAWTHLSPRPELKTTNTFDFPQQTLSSWLCTTSCVSTK